MKKRKSDVAKPANKNLRRAAKKELESGITLRFLEAVNNLGHDAERIAKDIKKMSKQIADKLSVQLKKSKKEEDKRKSLKGDKAGKVAGKREPKEKVDPVKSITRAKKVVAKVAKTTRTKSDPKAVIEEPAADLAKAPVRRGRRPANTTTDNKPVRRTRTARKPVAEPDAVAPKPRGRRPKSAANVSGSESSSPEQENQENETSNTQTTNGPESGE